MEMISRPSKRTKSLWNKGVDLILPPRCVVSGQIVSVPGTLAPEIWGALCFLTPPFCPGCGVPFPFETGGGDMRCAACLAAPPPFASARAALVYDDASRPLILKFKHADHVQAVPTLTGMMARAGAEQIAACDVIVPVPLHRWRLLRRRYNQSALLAWGLARITGKECLPDALLRTRATPSQGHLRAPERAANMRGAFTAHPRHADALRGRTILLVDDVLTTGATASACTKALHKAGASAVHVLAAARTIRE